MSSNDHTLSSPVSTISNLLSAPVAYHETTSPILNEPLLAAEAALLSHNAVEKRKQEFTTGRACARRALAKLHAPVVAITAGAKREPIWPSGFVGSITHCKGYAAAVVAGCSHLSAIGIDAEPHTQLPEGVQEHITQAQERLHLRELRALELGIHWDTLMFCIKEATYKAWFPLTQRWLGFADVNVVIDPQVMGFQVQFLVDGPVLNEQRLDSFSGRFAVSEAHLIAVIERCREK